jgi:DNA-directed RNA polymerase subunit RPC12/RpoP
MSDYVYRCTECYTTFEAVAKPPEDGRPQQVPCPVCGDRSPKQAFPADDADPPHSHYTPGTGCCGTPGSS